MWLQVAVSWNEVVKLLKVNSGCNTMTEEDCLGFLRNIAESQALTSHQLRVLVMLRSDGQVLADVDIVRQSFSTSKPQAVLSYRWQVPLDQLLDGLKQDSGLGSDMLVWIDIYFNPQNFNDLDCDAVVAITRRQYTDEEAIFHFLFIGEDDVSESWCWNVL
jgi:hypothetical protein